METFIPYQTCPICNGSGQVPAEGFTSVVYDTCPVCNGARIIPMHCVNKSSFTYEDWKPIEQVLMDAFTRECPHADFDNYEIDEEGIALNGNNHIKGNNFNEMCYITWERLNFELDKFKQNE